MANEKAILLQDMIATVAGEMSLPISPIYAQGEKGYNVQFEDFAQQDMPALAYDLAQSGTYDIRVNEKVYLEYTTTLLFLDFMDGYREEAQSVIRQMHLVAIEFLQRLQRLDAYADVPENERLSPSFTERAFIFDTNLGGIQASFTIKIDPNVNTPSC